MTSVGRGLPVLAKTGQREKSAGLSGGWCADSAASGISFDLAPEAAIISSG
jgi:hypothetical protein